MALDPKPRGMIWVSQSDYNSVKTGSHKPSFSVQPDATKPNEDTQDMAAWFFAYARCFRSNYMYYLSASQLTAKDPSDTGVKAVLETEEAGQYAYMCFEDLDMTKFTDGQFNLVKQLIEKQYTASYSTYVGVLAEGGPDSNNGQAIKADVLSVSVVLPPLRNTWNTTAPYAAAMTTSLCTIILKFNGTEWQNLAPITVAALMSSSFLPSPPDAPVPTDNKSALAYTTAWQNYYVNCTKALADAIQNAIESSKPLPAVPTSHIAGPGTGSTTLPSVSFAIDSQETAITVTL